MDSSMTKHTPACKGGVSIGGIWRRRLEDSIINWALHIDEDLLLDGFRHRPGVQAWIGEHIGKYLDGAIRCNRIVQNDELWKKISRLAEELPEHQEPDGYIGTHAADQRWKSHHWTTGGNCSWDVWVFKYSIIGLLDYYELKGWQPALETAKKAADLLARIFGPEGDKNINYTDVHNGVASGSVLEAIMRLYQHTHDRKYLDLADRIVKHFWEMDDPEGPRLMRILRQRGPVHLIARGKAYEMMSCFVGLVEYCRVTGDAEILAMVIDARNRIADQLRHVTGCMSEREWFKAPGEISERADLENCVAFTWMQLNTRIFELTGDERSLELTEETAWNHIMASICPEASTWSYHLKLTGPKDFTYWSQLPDIKGFRGAPLTCCHTNGQRALGLVPEYIYTADTDNALYVNFYGPSEAVVNLPGLGEMQVRQETDFPAGGAIRLHIDPPNDREYQVCLRIPGWTDCMTVNGKEYAPAQERVTLALKGRQVIEIQIRMNLRLIAPGFVNRGKYAVAYGPLVMAVDECPDGWALDEVALVLDSQEPFRGIGVERESGWPSLRIPAFRFPLGICDVKGLGRRSAEGHGTVKLRPVMFAGLGRNLAFAQSLKPADGAKYDRTEPLKEYRVLAPCVFHDRRSASAGSQAT